MCCFVLHGYKRFSFILEYSVWCEEYKKKSIPCGNEVYYKTVFGNFSARTLLALTRSIVKLWTRINVLTKEFALF